MPELMEGADGLKAALGLFLSTFTHPASVRKEGGHSRMEHHAIREYVLNALPSIVSICLS